MATNLEIAGALKRTQKGDADWYYGGDNEAWADLASAKAGVPAAIRPGKTVGVFVSGSIVEYWWPTSAVADGDLILKQSGVAGFNGRSGDVVLSGSDVESALGYTPSSSADISTEATARIANDAATLASAKGYADGLLVSVYKDCGNWDASTGLFPTTGGTGTSGAIKAGNAFEVSVAGTAAGEAFDIGDIIRALADTPGQTLANWARSEHNTQQATESNRGTAKIVDQTTIQTETSTDDLAVVTTKKFWFGISRLITIAQTITGNWNFTGTLKQNGNNVETQNNKDANNGYAGLDGSGNLTKSTDNLPEGSSKLYFTAGRVLSTVLTGLSLGNSSVVSATNTIPEAIGQLQAQISQRVDMSTNQTSIGGNKTFTGSVALNGGASISGSTSAVAGTATGVSVTPTLTQVANNDALYAIDIEPIFQTAPIATVTLTTGGSGYTNGTYTTATATGSGNGRNAVFTVVVSGGTVTSITSVNNGGFNYIVGEVLNLLASSMGNTGAGASITITSLTLTGALSFALRANGDVRLASRINSNLYVGTGGSLPAGLAGAVRTNQVVFSDDALTRINTTGGLSMQTAAMLSFNFGITGCQFTGQAKYLNIFGTTGNLTLQNGGTYTDAGYRLDIDGAIRGKGIVIASSGAARGLYLNQSLLPFANNDTLIGLDINNILNIGASAIATLGAITPGSGYGNNTLLLALTGGSGTGATATITISGNAVTAVVMVNRGTGYVAGDVLSATIPLIVGGTGGFSVHVATVGLTGVTYRALRLGGDALINGNLELGAPGNKIKIATGTNASVGTAMLSAGTVTVNTTAVTASSIIMLSLNTPDSISVRHVYARNTDIIAGTSFVINSSDGTDTSTVNWWIIN